MRYMSEPRILDYKNFDFRNLQYDDPIKSVGGCYVANLSYLYEDNLIPVYIQTPRLKIVSDVDDTTKTLELEIDPSDNTNVDFYDFMTRFNNINTVTCHKRSMKWFDTHFPLPVIDKSYVDPIKANRNRPPSFKIKLQTIKNKYIATEIYNDRKQPAKVDYLNKEDYIVAIIEINGLQFYKTTFQIDMSLSQIKVFKDNKEKLTGYHIQDDIRTPVEFLPDQNDEADEISSISPDELTDNIELEIEKMPPQNKDNSGDELSNLHSDPDTDSNSYTQDDPEYKSEPEYKSDDLDNEDDTLKTFNLNTVNKDSGDESGNELETVNWGIDNFYLDQINIMKENIQNMKTRYSNICNDNRIQEQQYYQNIEAKKEEYKEYCHRYNVEVDL